MKKKIGLLALTAFAGIAVVCATSISAKQPFTGDAPFAQNQRREKLATRVEGAHLGGNAIYLKMKKDSAWAADSAKVSIHFWNDSTSGWSGFLTEKYTDSYGAAVFEGIVPTPSSGTSWTGMKAVRFNPVGSDGESFTNSWNETNDITIYNGVQYQNEIEVSSTDGGKHCSYGLYKVGAGERLKYYAWAFGWSAPEGDGMNICTNNNDSGYLATLSASWDLSQTAAGGYNNLGADVKAYFSNVVANESLSTTDGTGAGLAARYDHIVAAHGLTNFASR